MTTTGRVPESVPPQLRPARRAATPIYISEHVRTILLVALLVVLLVIAWAAPGGLIAAGGGAFLAIVLSLPVNALARFMPRWLAMLVAFLVLGGLGVLVLFLVVPPLLAHLGDAITDAPALAAQVEAFLRADILEPLEARGLLPDEVDAVVHQLDMAAFSRLADLAQGILDGALGFLSGAVGVGFFIFSVVVIGGYLLGDARRMKARFLRTVPRAYRHDAHELWQTMGRNVSRSFLASLASNTIQGVVAFVGLTLIGVPFADLLGAIMWMTAFVPIFGSWLGFFPAALAALTVSPQALLLTAVLYLAINLLDGNVLCPRLQGTALSLPPVVVLVAIIAAGELFGLAGIVATPLIMAAVAVLVRFFGARLVVRRRVIPVAVVGSAPSESPARTPGEDGEPSRSWQSSTPRGE